MIGKIKGHLIDLQENAGLIETPSGVSYEVFLPNQVINTVHIGDSLDLLTYLQVREDAFVLFGFQSKDQQRFFKLLLTVSGVGPKTAFNIISHTVTHELLTAVRENNVEYFTQIPGLGKKTSLKIILELSQNIKSEFKFDSISFSDDDKTVIDALVTLGFKTHEAKTLFAKIPKDLSIENKIKFALQLTVKKNKDE